MPHDQRYDLDKHWRRAVERAEFSGDVAVIIGPKRSTMNFTPFLIPKDTEQNPDRQNECGNLQNDHIFTYLFATGCGSNYSCIIGERGGLTRPVVFTSMVLEALCDFTNTVCISDVL